MSTKGRDCTGQDQRSMELRILSAIVANSKCLRKDRNGAVIRGHSPLCALSPQLVVVEGHKAHLCLMKCFLCKLLCFFVLGFVNSACGVFFLC